MLGGDRIGEAGPRGQHDPRREVVPQVRPDGGERDDGLHPDHAERLGRADPAAQEDRGRPVGPRADDHHRRLEEPSGTLADDPGPAHRRPAQLHPVGGRPVDDRQVRPVASRVQICERRVPAHAAALVDARRPGAPRCTVEVVEGGEARLDGGLEHRLVPHARPLPAGGADHGLGRAPVGLQHPRRPALPPLVVVGIGAPRDDARVVGRAPADHACRPAEALVIEPIVGVGELVGVEEIARPAAGGERAVVRPCLDEADAAVRILAQPSGEDASRRPAAEDDDVVLSRHGGAMLHRHADIRCGPVRQRAHASTSTADRVGAPMLLTISTTHRPAMDLGFLLHKNPAERKSYELWFGAAHVFYPAASEERCTVALLLDVDAVGLVRGRRRGGATRYDYVNDRPYVASSFLSVALAKAFATAMNGRSKERPELAASAIPLEVEIATLPSGAGGDELLRRMFEPLGYAVETRTHPLDPAFPEWGGSRYLTVRLTAECRLADLLRHLYVLIPVMDNQKHYWVGHDEVEKLLARGGTWLGRHPERDLIANRYLRYQRPLAAGAIARLVAEEQPDPDEAADSAAEEEAVVEEPIRLVDQRMGAVVAALRSAGATSVVDLGCGEGRLLRELLADRRFTRIAARGPPHPRVRVFGRSPGGG